MNASEFSQVNTSISVRERTFLTGEQLKQMLAASDNETLSLQLANSNYHISAADLSKPDQIEKALMTALAQEYQFAYQEAPDKRVVDIFALKYTYHNLKCLLKARATDFDLSSLLIPIGAYDMADLTYLVSSLQSSACDPILVDEVQDAWRDYQEYRDLKAIDLGMDYAYFHHLRKIEQAIDHPPISELVNAMIDFYNIIAAKRANEQGKPNSFTYKVMSNSSQQEMADLNRFVQDDLLATWFSPMNLIDFGHQFDESINRMKQATVTASELERVRDRFLQALLDRSKLDSMGPMPLLRYLYGKEMEVSNLRLILTGKANSLSQDQLIERMKPVYGES
ncbi:V-type ATPase subunit [Vaginisenegalia massiliensis]|uniref:V-type ATPase subunit n=1 Tax=Vaginisenegalia massiliensis TaxID=2058294 RepID=UPI000F522DCA|nr:V-type ATPase subunit [Vaginisenegalia massiliensis]